MALAHGQVAGGLVGPVSRPTRRSASCARLDGLRSSLRYRGSRSTAGQDAGPRLGVPAHADVVQHGHVVEDEAVLEGAAHAHAADLVGAPAGDVGIPKQDTAPGGTVRARR